MTYRIAPLPLTFSDLEGYFCCLKPFCLASLGNTAYIVYDMSAHE